MKINNILILIILLAAILRLPLLGSFPNGFSGDEANQGYSAYSISKTAKDEWGEFLPLFPRGFGDYKPPILTYLTVPFVALFGLEIQSVRFPTALVGNNLLYNQKDYQ
jgi:4-amino-4-deoxy-L-arabinose transferase-like glycosyltransferase